MKRFMAILLTLAFALSALSLTAVGESTVSLPWKKPPAAGVELNRTWGNLSWHLSLDGVLTVTGEGPMDPLGPDDGWKFYNKESVEAVVISEGITSIGANAFAQAERLTSVTIPSTVTSIGNSAFMDCTSLEEITLPDSVTEIGGYAFFGCESLKSISIPEGVTRI